MIDVLGEIPAGDTTLLAKLQNPIRFERVGAGGSQSSTYGYEATLFIDLCDAIIKAGEIRNKKVQISYFSSTRQDDDGWRKRYIFLIYFVCSFNLL